MLIGAMRSAGLHPLDLQTSGNFKFAGVDVSWHIEVPTEELDRAKKFLQALATPSETT